MLHGALCRDDLGRAGQEMLRSVRRCIIKGIRHLHEAGFAVVVGVVGCELRVQDNARAAVVTEYRPWRMELTGRTAGFRGNSSAEAPRIRPVVDEQPRRASEDILAALLVQHAELGIEAVQLWLDLLAQVHHN